VLETCFPWGLLLQLRFVGGEFIGEVFNLTEGGKQDKVKFLSVTFKNNSEGSNIDNSLGINSIEVCGLPATHFQATKPSIALNSNLLFPRWKKQVSFPPALTLQVSISQPPDTNSVAVHGKLCQEYWSTKILRRTNDALLRNITTLLNVSRSFQMRQVNGPFQNCFSPNQFFPTPKHYEIGFPNLKQGLYVGNYHPELYGQFSQEVISITFQIYDFTSETSLASFNKDIFRGNKMDAVLKLVNDSCVQQDDKKNVVFIVGRKVTGDPNVPMGAVTFFGIVHPKAPPQVSEFVEQTVKIKIVKNGTQTVTRVPVRTKWPGFGTLSITGFIDPSWDSCCLLQIETPSNEGVNSGLAFALCWNSWRGDTVTELHWLEEQNNQVYHNDGSFWKMGFVDLLNISHWENLEKRVHKDQ